jgi:hypothetical protein
MATPLAPAAIGSLMGGTGARGAQGRHRKANAAQGTSLAPSGWLAEFLRGACRSDLLDLQLCFLAQRAPLHIQDPNQRKFVHFDSRHGRIGPVEISFGSARAGDVAVSPAIPASKKRQFQSDDWQHARLMEKPLEVSMLSTAWRRL